MPPGPAVTLSPSRSQLLAEVRAVVLAALLVPTAQGTVFRFRESGMGHSFAYVAPSGPLFRFAESGQGRPFGEGTFAPVMRGSATFAPIIYLPPEVVDGLDNRVAAPRGPGYVVLTPIGQVRQSTNVDLYDRVGDVQARRQGTRYSLQIDCYGPQSSDWATTLSVLLRSSWACEMMTVGKPLYVNDPLQLPLVDGEQQYEERWMVQAQFQYNPTVRTPVAFADTVRTPAVNIYPPVNTL